MTQLPPKTTKPYDFAHVAPYLPLLFQNNLLITLSKVDNVIQVFIYISNVCR